MTQIDPKPPDATGSYRADPHCISCAVLASSLWCCHIGDATIAE
jgi:hypothetical protein